MFGLDGPEPEVALEGNEARCIAVDPRDPQRVYVWTMGSGLWFSADGGASWREAGPSIDEPRVLSVAVSRSHEHSGVSVVYAGTEPSNLYRSEDGGLSWQPLPALRELPSASSWSFPPRPWTHHVRTIALHPTDPEWLAVGIELGGVMRSRDGRRELVTVGGATARRDRSGRSAHVICEAPPRWGFSVLRPIVSRLRSPGPGY